MLVSIIVPIYNEAEALPGFLAHLQKLRATDLQADDGLELLLVDGGSSDASIKRIEEAGIPYLRAERGRAAQMNAGAAAATGEILLFLHADTVIDQETISAARSAVREGAVGGFFALRLSSSRPLLRIVGKMISFRSRLSGVASGDQAIFVTRSAFNEIGGYAPLPLFEDLDLCRRLKRSGRFVALDALVITSSRRWERGGTVATILRMWMLRVLYYCGVSPARLSRHYGEAR
jgi:rSAM/selenodomain-associated transferase 2